MSLFVVFEGIDGSGNTTQSKLLAEFLRGRVYDVLLTKEPTNNVIGKIIRDVLQKKVKTSPLALQMLFVADRAYHLHTEIEPALEEGRVVISDRYMLSTMAFGGINVDMDFLKQLNSKFRVPDITFILDVPPEIALRRIKSSRPGEPELFEELEKSKRVYANYMKLKDQFPNVFVINGNRVKEAVAAEVQKIVLSKLK
jgi:dTMP kinase